MGRFQFPGLHDGEVLTSKARYGINALPAPEVETFWEKLVDNFKDPLIKILGIALAITCVLALFGYASWIEGIGIAVAVFLATFVATYSEHKNEETFQSLQREASERHSTVFRNGGQLVQVSSDDIVVGDFVVLQPGDIVPADGMLVAGSLLVNQAQLNGEREGEEKEVALEDYVAANPEDFHDKSLVFRGSVVLDGEAVLHTKSVGLQTIYGAFVAKGGQLEERESPLQYKLGVLADNISKIGYVGASCIAVSFLFKQIVMDNHYSWSEILEYAMTGGALLHDIVKSVILAIIVIVVAVPEGLPMMIAIVLSLNMKRLMADKILVRKLLGIETAGSLSILFNDKTGNMTKGIFEPVMFLAGSLSIFRALKDVPPQLAQVLAFSIRESTESMFDNSGRIIGGNASDQALVQFLPPDLANSEDPDVNSEKHIMFNAARKFSSTQVHLQHSAVKKYNHVRTDDTGRITILKGAPELLLPLCKTYVAEDGAIVPILGFDAIQSEVDAASRRGIRVIVVATTLAHIESEHHTETPLGELCLVGVMGIRDEIRPTTKQAVAEAHAAGIHTVMVTGDKKETAVAVALEVGLLDQNTVLQPGVVITSAELKRMEDRELKALIPRLRVVARALPTDKIRLVLVAKEMQAVVGMTGDGVNDTGALRAADVGFAMGSGADVAKEAADIIVLDDNFSSVTKAALYGRTIFKSIRKFIVHQSTINLASMMIVFMGPFLGFDFPLTLIQLLWVNLVMDTLAALAFGGEPPVAKYMTERPIERRASIISPYMWTAIVCNGLYIALLSIIFLTYEPIADLFLRDELRDQDVFLTAFFCFFIFITNINAFNVRTPSTDLVDGLFENKNFLFVQSAIFAVQIIFTYLGGSWLRTVGLTFYEWVVVILLAATVVPFDLFRKVYLAPRLERSIRELLARHFISDDVV